MWDKGDYVKMKSKIGVMGHKPRNVWSHQELRGRKEPPLEYLE